MTSKRLVEVGMGMISGGFLLTRTSLRWLPAHTFFFLFCQLMRLTCLLPFTLLYQYIFYGNPVLLVFAGNIKDLRKLHQCFRGKHPAYFITRVWTYTLRRWNVIMVLVIRSVFPSHLTAARCHTDPSLSRSQQKEKSKLNHQWINEEIKVPWDKWKWKYTGNGNILK